MIKAALLFLTILVLALLLLMTLGVPPSLAPTTAANAPASGNAGAGWRTWLHDERLPAVLQRLTIVEEQLQQTITQGNALAERLQATESKLATLAASPPASLQTENGSLIAKKGDNNWKLTDIFARQRQFRQRITFTQPFAQPPKIMLGITLLELPGEKLRLQARAEEIDRHGFTLLFESRSDSRIEEMQVDWFAVAEGALRTGSP
ncbi:MAG: H-type lectin domain-containing protein [Magnetococcales bacterium]|nr:H-type lectin domain-containing protein [Magnetococcales bacterium]